MEQYILPPENFYDDLQYSLQNYVVKRIYIRDCGADSRPQGEKKVGESLEGRVLEIKQIIEGLSIVIDGSEVFKYDLDEFGKFFSVEHRGNSNKNKGIPPPPSMMDPNNPNSLPIHTSIFRSGNSDYLLEITFEGKIPLKFHSWCREPNIKYWCVDKSGK